MAIKHYYAFLCFYKKDMYFLVTTFKKGDKLGLWANGVRPGPPQSEWPETFAGGRLLERTNRSLKGGPQILGSFFYTYCEEKKSMDIAHKKH